MKCCFYSRIVHTSLVVYVQKISPKSYSRVFALNCAHMLPFFAAAYNDFEGYLPFVLLMYGMICVHRK